MNRESGIPSKKMSISSPSPKKSIVQAFLSRQDTSTTIGSNFSTSCSNFDSEISLSTASKHKSNVRTREIYHEGLIAYGDEKTMKRIKSHYYPEYSMWGNIVAVIACLVQISNHGLHNSFGVLSVKINDTFIGINGYEAGEVIYMN